MNRSFLSALTCAIVSACSHQLAASPGSDASTRAGKTLEAAAQAYQRLAALNDTLTYVIKTPSGVQAPKTLEIRLGAGRNVAVKDALFEVVAFDRTLYLTKGDAPGKYVAQPYSGDFARSLEAIVGAQGWPFEPIQIAMRLGKNQDGWLQGLRFGQLGPLKISGYEKKSIDGRSVEVIHLTAQNGGIEADFDSTTHFLSRIVMRARPPGAPQDVFIEVEGEFSPEILDSPKGLVTFDTGDKVAVADMTSLDSTRLPTGGPAASFNLERLGGGRLSLGELKGSAVVLDFWATWCAPCWKTLRESQRLADWAVQSGLPVAVLAIDTLEESPTATEKRDKAAKFFQSQGLTMPCLLDLDGKVFQAFGSPGLPSMIVVAPDGTVFKHHQGLFPNMLEVLKLEIREALSAGKDSGSAGQIRSVRQEVDGAFQRHDAKQLARLVSSDCRFTSPTAHIDGSGALERFHASLFMRRADIILTHHPSRIVVNEDWDVASEQGDWIERWTEKDGVTELRGTYLTIWKRDGGDWREYSETLVPETCTGSSYCH